MTPEGIADQYVAYRTAGPQKRADILNMLRGMQAAQRKADAEIADRHYCKTDTCKCRWAIAAAIEKGQ